jgi:hypothetical protein
MDPRRAHTGIHVQDEIGANMNRLLLMALALAVLPGCADLPAQRLLASWLSDKSAGSAEYREPARYRFDWRLSGDRRVGPLQVFDDGARTWLQFDAGQAVPAIFSRDAYGDILLTYRREGGYVVLEGVRPLLVLRGGALESRVSLIDASDTSSKGEASAHVPPVLVRPASPPQPPLRESEAAIDPAQACDGTASSVVAASPCRR